MLRSHILHFLRQVQPDRNPSTEAPLTARSIVASTLLGARPPELPSWALVRAGETFGIAEGTTRVALSRMVAAGELETDDGRYRLAGRLLDRLARQDTSRRPPLKRWDGTWRQAVVIAPSRTAAQRADLRSAMRELRFAELREGVWVRPDDLAEDDAPRARAVADEQCMWLRASVADPSALAEELWDLAGWARRAQTLRRRMRTSRRELDDPTRGALRDGFVLAAAVLRHMQADPLMPPDLLADDWPGRALRAEYDDYARVFARRWTAWLSASPEPMAARTS
jgi:phenylacetic acid degradation operon negative regulatory protein